MIGTTHGGVIQKHKLSKEKHPPDSGNRSSIAQVTRHRGRVSLKLKKDPVQPTPSRALPITIQIQNPPVRNAAQRRAFRSLLSCRLEIESPERLWFLALDMWHEGICLPDIVAETLELRHDNCINNGLRTGRSPGSEILGKRYRKSLVFPRHDLQGSEWSFPYQWEWEPRLGLNECRN